MSRRSIAHAERVIVEGKTATGRGWSIAVRVPQTREVRDPDGWDRSNPTSRKLQKERRQSRRANAR